MSSATRETRATPRPPVENVGPPARWDEIHIAPDGDALPLLEELEGQLVDAVVRKCLVKGFKGEQVLELRLELLRNGEPWVEVPCYFRLPARLRDGRTVILRRSKYYLHWVRMNGHRRPSRRDRMSPVRTGAGAVDECGIVAAVSGRLASAAGHVRRRRGRVA